MKASRSVVALMLAGGAALVAVAVAIPFFPRGTDLYVHVLWPWQVMRCLHAGSLPVWLPDLNAAFGSPGIGLYSPLGPSICGVLGLILGTGGRGVRAALALAAILVMLVAPGRNHWSRLAKAGLVLLSPAMLTEFFSRFPVSQLLGVPLAWLLLEHAAERRWRWDRDGVLFALLWLVHAPTAMMVAMMSGLAVFAVRTDTPVNSEGHSPAGVRGQLLGAWQLGAAGLVAAGLSFWHWWPLLASAPNFPLRSALTGGEHHPLRNLIGVSGPHLPEINIAMGWAALGLLVALGVSGAWKTNRGRLALVAIVLASLLSAPLWRYFAPLAWLQFPWRWMLPATLLATTAILDEAPKRGRLLLGVSLAAMIVPLIGVPALQLVPDPGLGVATDPVMAGERVMESFSGNPLLVDVMEHRPAWWKDLGETMVLLGPRRVAMVPEGGAPQVVGWKPLERRIEVESPHPTTLVLRLLADPHWMITVNQRPAVPDRWGAALAVSLPPGRSEVAVRWATDPRAVVGAIVAAILLTFIALRRRRRQATPKM
ncbi:MAG: hypothetical protein OQK55_03055 [Thermoanaerobaculales bacterium]|nr:hypothetical protein [Thermoanaerobaculales bacterium]